jgi:hypothetical protein
MAYQPGQAVFRSILPEKGAVSGISKFKLVDGKLVLPGATKEALKASPEFEYAK